MVTHSKKYLLTKQYEQNISKKYFYAHGTTIQKKIDQRAAQTTFFQMQVNDTVSFEGKQ